MSVVVESTITGMSKSGPTSFLSSHPSFHSLLDRNDYAAAADDMKYLST